MRGVLARARPALHRVEWPQGSGQVALYTEEERLLQRRLLDSGTATARQEAELIHAFKVEFRDSVLS